MIDPINLEVVPVGVAVPALVTTENRAVEIAVGLCGVLDRARVRKFLLLLEKHPQFDGWHVCKGQLRMLLARTDWVRVSVEFNRATVERVGAVIGIVEFKRAA